MSLDIFNFDTLYNQDFSYSLPKTELEKYLAGNAFDHKEKYTPEELQRLCHDIETLYARIVPEGTSQDFPHEAIMTAGGPGVGKTLLMRSHVEKIPHPYICPDDVCLKNQTESYLADISGCDQSRDARQELYNKWRPGSNAATHIILATLIKNRHSFYFGTTSSGPFTYKLLDLLAKQGYKITFLHLTSPNEVCWESLKKRDKIFIQTTEKDIIEKALLVPQRIHDTYLKYASTIQFYYRDEVDQDALLTATWIRNEPGSECLGSLTITDPVHYENIKKIHNAVADKLNRPELLWENSVERCSQISISKEPVSVS